MRTLPLEEEEDMCAKMEGRRGREGGRGTITFIQCGYTSLELRGRGGRRAEMKTARERERRRVGSSPNLEGHLYSVNLHCRSLGVRRGVEEGWGREEGDMGEG